jgi:hypothetical protein
VNEDNRTWEGVLIFEVQAKFQSTAEHPRSTNPDDEGNRLRQVVEDALRSDAARGQFEVGEVRYAGGRGSTHYD